MLNKKLIATILLTFITLTVFANIKDASELSSDKKITVSRIRVYLDDIEISAEDFEGSAPISAATILSFSSLKPGKVLSIKALEKEVQQTQFRLINSGYFYNATVEIVPPRKNPEKRTVIISVTTGFLPRFGGGGIYALFGKIALGGKRNRLIGTAGWNINGVSYLDENLFDLPLIAGASAYTNIPYCFTQKDSGINFDGTLTAGGFINPSLQLCLDFLVRYNTKFGLIQSDFIVSPYLFNEYYFSSKLQTTTEIRLYYKPVISFSNIYGELCQTVNYSPINRINVGAIVCGGFSPFGDYEYSYDLSLNHKSVSGSAGLSHRCIRSGYDDIELLFKKYAQISLEARISAANFKIAKTFPCNLKPLVYTDLVFGEQLVEEQGNQYFFDAYGIGIQINFDCPVFAYFNFTYGINHFGKGKFCFYTGLTF